MVVNPLEVRVSFIFNLPRHGTRHLREDPGEISRPDLLNVAGHGRGDVRGGCGQLRSGWRKAGALGNPGTLVRREGRLGASHAGGGRGGARAVHSVGRPGTGDQGTKHTRKVEGGGGDGKSSGLGRSGTHLQIVGKLGVEVSEGVVDVWREKG